VIVTRRSLFTSAPLAIAIAIALGTGALALRASTAHGQQTAQPSEDAAAIGAPTTEAPRQPSPHPLGVAERPNEAPGSTGLVALPGESLPRLAQVAPTTASDPGAERAMAFSSGGGECRDTIPGGPVLAAAYALILALLGAYAFWLGRKNAQLGAQLDELEQVLERKSETKGA
jgi:hypothetical protein